MLFNLIKGKFIYSNLLNPMKIKLNHVANNILL
jgi:hypothetical protein